MTTSRKKIIKFAQFVGKLSIIMLTNLSIMRKKIYWICRDHTTKETERALGRPLTKDEKNWVEHTINY